MSEEAPPTPREGQIYFPEPGEKQLTTRSLVVGCIVGSVVSCTNIYIGLKIGWTFGASIICAVLGFAFLNALGKKMSVLETNITQTAGSAAGAMASAAGLVAAIPAMELLGYEITWYQLVGWTLAIAFLGVFFAVPLRRQMVEVDKLRFPTGTATANTVVALLAEAKEATAKAKVLLWAGLGAAIFTLIAHFVPELENPPLHTWIGGAFLGTLAAWGFKLYLGPALFGAGFLIGPRVAFSLLLGAVVAWGAVGPLAKSAGWARTATRASKWRPGSRSTRARPRAARPGPRRRERKR